MKKMILFLMVSQFAFAGPTAPESVVQIGIGTTQSNSQKDLLRRVSQLEMAVTQLQRRVFSLQEENQNLQAQTSLAQSAALVAQANAQAQAQAQTQYTSCFVTTPFNGTFEATAPTETGAKSQALKKCGDAGVSSVFCSESNLKCGK